jgi:hypothetical protein
MFSAISISSDKDETITGKRRAPTPRQFQLPPRLIIPPSIRVPKHHNQLNYGSATPPSSASTPTMDCSYHARERLISRVIKIEDSLYELGEILPKLLKQTVYTHAPETHAAVPNIKTAIEIHNPTILLKDLKRIHPIEHKITKRSESSKFIYSIQVLHNNTQTFFGNTYFRFQLLNLSFTSQQDPSIFLENLAHTQVNIVAMNHANLTYKLLFGMNILNIASVERICECDIPSEGKKIQLPNIMVVLNKKPNHIEHQKKDKDGEIKKNYFIDIKDKKIITAFTVTKKINAEDIQDQFKKARTLLSENDTEKKKAPASFESVHYEIDFPPLSIEADKLNSSNDTVDYAEETPKV